MAKKIDKFVRSVTNPEAQKKAIRAFYAKRAVPERFPHFRYYFKSGHPALIESEFSKDEYNFRKVSHSAIDGGRENMKIEPNPNPKDSKPMYATKRIRHDKKTHFGKKLPWKLKK